MKAYQVQFILPCEQPLENITRTVKRGVVHFQVPINTPDIQNLGYSFLATNSRDDIKVSVIPDAEKGNVNVKVEKTKKVIHSS